MLLNYNTQNQFNNYLNQPGINWDQSSSKFVFPQTELANPVACSAKKSEEFEPEKNSSLNDQEQIEDGIEDFISNENDDEYLYLTIELSSQAVDKLKNMSQDQINQIKNLGILGFQFEGENTTFRLENMGINSSQFDESQNKKRSKKTVMELTASNCSINESEPKSKKPKLRESDPDSSNCSENMSDELKNIYQIRQMLSQQAQKEEDISDKNEVAEKPKKSRQRAPPDPNKPKAKRSAKPKSEPGQEVQGGQQVQTQPPVRINQLIQQNAYINQANFQNKNQNTHFNNQHHYTNNQEQMKIRNILFYNSNQNAQEANPHLSNGFMDNQQKMSQNSNFLILNSNLNSGSDCNSNSNMTTNSDMSLTNTSYQMNNNNQINFLNI